MIRHLLRGIALTLLVASATLAQTASDETAIRSIVQDEIAAWNKGDAVAYSRHFAADGTFTNIIGQFFTGYEAFLKQHQVIFEGRFKQTTLQQDIVSLKFVRPDVAVVEVLTSVTGVVAGQLAPGTSGDPKGRLRTRLLQVVVKQGEEWKVVAYHNVDVKPGIPVAASLSGACSGCCANTRGSPGGDAGARHRLLWRGFGAVGKVHGPDVHDGPAGRIVHRREPNDPRICGPRRRGRTSRAPANRTSNEATSCSRAFSAAACGFWKCGPGDGYVDRADVTSDHGEAVECASACSRKRVRLPFLAPNPSAE